MCERLEEKFIGCDTFRQSSLGQPTSVPTKCCHAPDLSCAPQRLHSHYPMKNKQVHSPPSIRGHWTVSSRHCPMRHCSAAVQSLDSQVRLLQVAYNTQHAIHIKINTPRLPRAPPPRGGPSERLVRSRLVESSEEFSSMLQNFPREQQKISSILRNFSSHPIHPALITVTESRSE